MCAGEGRIQPIPIFTSDAILERMDETTASTRIAERKLRDRQARRAQILSAARRIAEMEGWPSVTVRRLSDEISYSQPVLYAHFGSREGILSAVATEGFQELGVALEKARKRARGNTAIEALASAYLTFASSAPALYEAMFSLTLNVPFADPATPAELQLAFAQLMQLFESHGSKSEILSELFWASLHGLAELTRTTRLPRSRQKERLKTLIELFTRPPA